MKYLFEQQESLTPFRRGQHKKTIKRTYHSLRNMNQCTIKKPQLSKLFRYQGNYFKSEYFIWRSRARMRTVYEHLYSMAAIVDQISLGGKGDEERERREGKKLWLPEDVSTLTRVSRWQRR